MIILHTIIKQGMTTAAASSPPPSLALTLPIQIRTDRFNHLTMDITPPLWKNNKILNVKYIESSKAKLNRSDTTTFWVRFEFSAVCRSQQEIPPKVKYTTSEMVEVIPFPFWRWLTRVCFILPCSTLCGLSCNLCVSMR